MIPLVDEREDSTSVSRSPKTSSLDSAEEDEEEMMLRDMKEREARREHEEVS